MKEKIVLTLFIILATAAVIMFSRDSRLFSLIVPFAYAHCDTVDGPVVKAARKALETGNVNPALIWVQKKDEAEIKKAFEKTLAVRKLNLQAEELADMYFFETLVRVHRAGEGEPYTGVKPAGSEVEPGILAADKSIETGSIDILTKEISNQITMEIMERFNRVIEKKKHMNKSVQDGREFVKAYVEFIHYVEQIYPSAEVNGAHHGAPEHPWIPKTLTNSQFRF